MKNMNQLGVELKINYHTDRQTSNQLNYSPKYMAQVKYCSIVPI